MQVINIPIENNTCYTRVVNVPQKCDYYFLSAGNNFTMRLDDSFPCINYNSSEWKFPNQAQNFFCNLGQLGSVSPSGNSIVLRGASLSGTTLSNYFSSFNCVPATSAVHTIKGYVTPNDQLFYIDLDDGSTFSRPQSDWTPLASQSTTENTPGGVIVGVPETIPTIVKRLSLESTGIGNPIAFSHTDPVTNIEVQEPFRFSVTKKGLYRLRFYYSNYTSGLGESLTLIMDRQADHNGIYENVTDTGATASHILNNSYALMDGQTEGIMEIETTLDSHYRYVLYIEGNAAGTYGGTSGEGAMSNIELAIYYV